MLKILFWSPAGEIVQTEDVSRLKEVYLNKTHALWVDMDEPTEEELSLLETLFHFHPFAIKAVRDELEIPKLGLYEDYAFLVLHRVFYQFKTEACERREFEVFFSERFIVTIHGGNLSRTFAAARDKVYEHPKEMVAHGTGYVLFRLLNLAIQDYNPALAGWQESLDEMEQKVLRDVKDGILEKILEFKKVVSVMRKNLLPEREVLKELYESKDVSFIRPGAKPYFKAVLDNMNTLLRELDGIRDHAASVFDVYAAMLTIKMTESSHQLNFVMQRLTIAATIFMPLTFIVGVYGMNFEYMPEFHWKGFYYLLWAIMLAIAGGMLYFFKRKKWF
ncbi:MAG: magnesium and cobalt transport protein CorA [Deltaproteobacteria bacterium RIFCSPLOWO2_02_FULL_46_8]|nr:MAG: magnesium and cobalt transport protein CorA [Deltaproteobacteria bacterium RIFCSPLOWO2_02_FULL_46_8]